VFSLGGLLCFTVPRHYELRRRLARTQGTPVQATVTEIRLDRNLKVGQQSPWVIVATAPDDVTGQELTFTSRYLWDDPEPRFPVGSEVTVYYLPDRPKVCAFELEKAEGE
jgi:hypothetical protein